ncbi:MAG: hypothetical protein ACRDU4_07755 [Mycobacterium sp.]
MGVKTAVSEWVPSGSELMRRANPSGVTGTGAASGVVPSMMNWTAPTAASGATLVRKITGTSSTAWLGVTLSVVVVSVTPGVGDGLEVKGPRALAEGTALAVPPKSNTAATLTTGTTATAMSRSTNLPRNDVMAEDASPRR